jgi:hypothetical protein
LTEEGKKSLYIFAHALGMVWSENDETQDIYIKPKTSIIYRANLRDITLKWTLHENLEMGRRALGSGTMTKETDRARIRQNAGSINLTVRALCPTCIGSCFDKMQANYVLVDDIDPFEGSKNREWKSTRGEVNETRALYHDQIEL